MYTAYAMGAHCYAIALDENFMSLFVHEEIG